MRMLTGAAILALTLAVPVGLACSSAPTSPTTVATSSTAADTTTASSPASLSAMYQQFSSAVTVQVSGTTVILSSKGVPDHPSPYWGAGNPLYEAPQAGMQVNPNLIVAQNFVVRVPLSPTAAGASSDTPLGAMGMAVNGVALFNQYAAGRQPLSYEVLSFDRYNGHPQQTGVYHYHMNPLWITSGHPAALVGVLLDGFPVYGPQETDGSTPSGLDSCNGHVHATPEFPNGIYHYHITSSTPYIAGCFKGTPGTASE
jgi:hypothetical protein